MRFLFGSVWFSPANHQSTIAPYSNITASLSRAIALTTQHIITSSVFKSVILSLTRHLAGHKVRKLVILFNFVALSIGLFNVECDGVIMMKGE
jgi:hypothetical protein